MIILGCRDMTIFELDNMDYILIERAKDIIKRLYEKDKHHIGSAILTKSGKIITAVHVEAYVGRITLCAEAVAIGKAISEGEKEFERIVAVRYYKENDEYKIVTPCGMCRELIYDYSPKCLVIIPFEEKLTKCSIKDLLPLKYSRD